MTIGEFHKQSAVKLQKVGIGSANLDVLILLEDALHRDRAWILAHPEAPLHSQTLRKLDKQIARRANHEPLSYIRGETEFYGRDFYVNEYVLEPRPESETMIILLKNLLAERQSQRLDTIVDIGTGSGALAITAKLEAPDNNVMAIDIDPNCIKVSRKNAKTHGAKIRFFQGDLLEPLISSKFEFHSSIILANLPYVPNDFVVNQAAAMEPKVAIFGGPDGLDIYRRFFWQLSGRNKPKYVISESLPPQHIKLAKIAQKAGYRLVDTDDFIQVFNI
jgi:release factor glutamine methyltransferase